MHTFLSTAFISSAHITGHLSINQLQTLIEDQIQFAGVIKMIFKKNNFNQQEPEPHQYEIDRSISTHRNIFGATLLICSRIFLVWGHTFPLVAGRLPGYFCGTWSVFLYNLEYHFSLYLFSVRNSSFVILGKQQLR